MTNPATWAFLTRKDTYQRGHQHYLARAFGLEMSGFLKIIYYPYFSGYVGDEVVLSQREELKHDLAKLEKLDKYQDALRKRRLAEEPPRDKALAVKEEGVGESETKSEVKMVEIDGKTVEIDGKKDDVENTCKDESDEPEGVIVDRKDEKTNSVDDGQHVVPKGNDPCVYTLERALDEMKIGTEISDTERSNGDVKNVLEQTEYKDKTSKDTGENDHQVIKEIDVDSFKKEATTGKKVDSKEQRGEPRAMSQNVKSGPNLGESKTDYLMRLLDKRKSLLAKMADIQPLSAEGHDNVQGVNKLLKSNSDSAPVHPIQTSVIVSNDISGTEDEAKLLVEVDNIDKVTVLDGTRVSDVKVEPKSVQSVLGNQMHSQGSKSDKSKETCTKGKRTSLPEKKKSSIEVEKHIVSTLQLICKTIQAWLTVESVEYLNKIETEEPDPGRTEFERQYKALERKIDQQERDFDNMLGKNGLFYVFCDNS